MMRGPRKAPGRPEILISDVAGRADKRLINPDKPNLWRAIPYTTEGFRGVMLGCGLGRLQMPLEFLCSQELGVPLQPLRSRFGAVTAQNAGMLGYLESRGKA